MAGDIGLQWGRFEAEMQVKGNDLATDEGLETAIIISLFSDRRADASDILPDGETHRRGWYGDVLADLPDDFIGSKLWLLHREKQTPEVLRRAEQYAREGLQWLIDDRVAVDVVCTATYPAVGLMALYIQITRPMGNAITFRYDYNWAAQAANGA